MNSKKIMRYSFSLLLALLFSFNCEAVVATHNAENEELKTITKKELRQQKRIDRFMKRVENPKGLFKVYLKKQRKKYDSDEEFLDNLEEKAKWGLIGVLGGIALILLLRSELRFIGIIGIIAGIGLLIWSLLE